MNDTQIDYWAYKIMRACNRSTVDSDVNVYKLDKLIKEIYEQGRVAEREVHAKLCSALIAIREYKFMPSIQNEVNAEIKFKEALHVMGEFK